MQDNILGANANIERSKDLKHFFLIKQYVTFMSHLYLQFPQSAWACLCVTKEMMEDR